LSIFRREDTRSRPKDKKMKQIGLWEMLNFRGPGRVQFAIVREVPLAG